LKGSLPFLFFKDGMRELRFMEGIEEWEIKGLTGIIIQRDNINEFEDDLITLIWEKDLIFDKNSLFGIMSILEGQLLVKGISAQDLGFVWGPSQRGFGGFSR